MNEKRLNRWVGKLARMASITVIKAWPENTRKLNEVGSQQLIKCTVKSVLLRSLLGW